MKKNKFIYFLILIVISSFSFVFGISNVLANPTMDGLNETKQNINAYQKQSGSDYDNAFLASKTGEIIGVVLSFVGVLFLSLIIVGGLKWMTALGNDDKVKKAKTLIINATIGLLIVLFAYSITSFIGSQFSK